MAMQSANELFLRELVDLREVEQTILQMLPQEIRECGEEVQVSNAFTEWERDTRREVQNLDQCIQAFRIAPTRVESYVTRGLRQQHDSFLQERPSPQVTILFDLGELDKIKHYAIAAYGDLVEQAKVIDEPEVVRLLQENLSQEEAITRQVKQLSKQLRKRWAEQPAGSSRERG